MLHYFSVRDPNNYTSEDFTIPESLHIQNANIRTEVAQKVNAHYFPNDTVTLADAAKVISRVQYSCNDTAKLPQLILAFN